MRSCHPGARWKRQS